MREDWDTNITETSATDAVVYIADQYATYCHELQEMNTSQKKAKDDLESGWENVQSQLQQKRSEAIQRAQEDAKNTRDKLAKEKTEKIYQPRKDLSLIRQMNQTTSFRQKVANAFFKGSIGGNVQKEAQAKADMEEAYAATRMATQQMARAIAANRDAAIALANAEYDYQLASGQADYEARLQANEEKAERGYSALQRSCRRALIRNVGPDRVRIYRNTVSSYRQKAVDFECAKHLPEKIFMGWVFKELTAGASQVQNEASAMFAGALGDIIIPVAGRNIALLPYVQEVDRGLSLFVNYSSKDRGKYQHLMQALALKLFMAFPPGRLEATLIDPLELGKTFSMLTPLGAEQARIIDTKIWSQTQDITRQINILRTRMETLASSYGTEDAQEIRKRKVAYQLLAVTDFPNGFSNQALEDLRAIVRMSADYGVMILIFANVEEIAKLRENERNVIREIYQSLHVAAIDEKDPDRQLRLVLADQTTVGLELDTAEEIMHNSTAIVRVLAQGVHDSGNRIEYFDDMYDHIAETKNWLNWNSVKELDIPIGLRGANNVVRLILGRGDSKTQHHVLIAGPIGSGKTTLLHTMICSTLLNYPPDEVELYLVDFKEGVEFKTWYAQRRLPSIRVLAVDCEREFGLSILRKLRRIMEERLHRFSLAGTVDIMGYRQKTGEHVPRILVVFDEVQELFGGRQDEVTKESADLLRELLTLCRAAGIHFVLASQTFNLLPNQATLLELCAIRIALRGSVTSAQSVLGADNHGTQELQNQGAGAAVFNDESGDPAHNVIFQVAYLPDKEREKYLDELSAYQTKPEYQDQYPGRKTRILVTSAVDDPFNAFNCLIRDHTLQEMNARYARGYQLMIGEGVELDERISIGIVPSRGQNLLMVGHDVRTAASLFLFTGLSLLYGELQHKEKDKNNELIDLVDLSEEDELGDTSSIATLATFTRDFPGQVRRVGMEEMDEMIQTVYDRLQRRRMGEEDTKENVFLMIFGINRAFNLVSGGIYAGVGDDTPLSRLQEIMQDGAPLGIMTILWGETLAGTKTVAGSYVERDFGQRLVFHSDGETTKQLTGEEEPELLRPSTACFRNVYHDVRCQHLRPYVLPGRTWVDKIAKAYQEF